MNYGKKDKNPVNEMYFYSKNDVTKAKQIPEGQVSNIELKARNFILSLFLLWSLFFLKCMLLSFLSDV